MDKIAILYQAQKPPIKNGIAKPMKPGGYADSGADIGFTLKANNIQVLTPVEHPHPAKDQDWVFPDTPAGIEAAIRKGANVFWLNTVLFKEHPIQFYLDQGIEIIGQRPELVDQFDDKYLTNKLLKENGIRTPKATLIAQDDLDKISGKLPFPLVVKPIRGRGSQGVTVAHDFNALSETLQALFESGDYGTAAYLEDFLAGQEITVTVMPPGKYTIDGKEKNYAQHWSLPAVKRFNHQNGIAPYNGTVAVIRNSAVLEDEELASEEIKAVYRQCEKAAALVSAKAPIRIDCRASKNGAYFLFDLNMKPNMTGASRAHRKDQDSLSTLAARKINWTYADLLLNILNQKWKKA